MGQTPEEPIVGETESEVRLEIDGEGVNPDTVDARTTLELASAWFDLLVRVAKMRGSEVGLNGLSVVNKCVALATVPTSLSSARQAAAEAQDYITGSDEPYGLSKAVKRVKDARRALPVGHTAQVIVGPWRRELPLEGQNAPVPPYASVSLRAKPLRAGGQRPRVRFSSDSENEEFSLDVDENQARELGANLYGEVDITAVVWRDEQDVIRGGRLEEIFVIKDARDDVRSAMRAWLNENAPQWNDIDDIEAELSDRDDSTRG